MARKSDDVVFVIDNSTDWAAQLIWTDYYERPVRVAHPIRMDVKGAGFTLVSFESNPSAPDPSEVNLTYSTEIGLIQLSLPKEQTALFVPGTYRGDMLATVEDEDSGATFVMKLLTAEVIVENTITTL